MRNESNLLEPRCNVVAIFTPKPEHRDEIRSLLLRITPIVHDEPGCELYAMHEDVEGRFIYVETWTTRDDWTDHVDRQTVKDILTGVEGKLIGEIQVFEMHNLSTGSSGKGSLPWS
jgi:quinol monooxygenase YgiN|uniref:putative quinol monooxygenase n=1 Tax=Aquiluna sp. TaxID=2053504 RepID=UPI0040488819